MKYVVDASVVLAALLNEPKRKDVIKITKGAYLISPEIIPYEIGNAITSLIKRKRINSEIGKSIFKSFQQIPLRLVQVNIENALDIAFTFNIYAYDAYYLECAQRMHFPLLTLDNKLKNVAKSMKISVWEMV
jgi:predicted nucleic acid-binding protein